MQGGSDEVVTINKWLDCSSEMLDLRRLTEPVDTWLKPCSERQNMANDVGDEGVGVGNMANDVGVEGVGVSMSMSVGEGVGQGVDEDEGVG